MERDVVLDDGVIRAFPVVHDGVQRGQVVVAGREDGQGKWTLPSGEQWFEVV